MNMFDILVVGAGPAGAWTAYRLARSGARVAIVDGSHPREKPCGGGVTGRALALVADALADRPLPAQVIRTARFVDSTRGRSAHVALAANAIDESSDLIVASRATFDARLLDAAVGAGASLVRARVTDCRTTGDGVELTTTTGTIRGARVVGADGANSLVRRRVARAFDRRQLSIATGFFAHGVTSQEIVVELAADPPGYFWSFPRPSHLALGVCAAADGPHRSGALRDRVQRWIASAHLAAPARLEPYAWPIPSLDAADFGRLRLAGPRWCLVGDAAGLVDPITREGIYFALQSGEHAAQALAADSGPRRYAERINDDVAPELARAARLKAGFFRPRFSRLLIQALMCSAPIRGVMADLVAGRQTYKGLQWRLARTFEIGLAWQALRS
jgi:geranylgeranyl reductase family protein